MSAVDELARELTQDVRLDTEKIISFSRVRCLDAEEVARSEAVRRRWDDEPDRWFKLVARVGVEKRRRKL